MKYFILLLTLIVLTGCSNTNSDSANKTESSVEFHGYMRAGSLDSIK